jgi:predicted phage terminase large subunit-like protein
MSETAKCYVKCKEIDEGKKAFLELLKQMKGVRDKTFDFELEFRRIKALCEIVEYVTQYNDYQGACMAYMYTLPRIIDLVGYMNTDVEERAKWEERIRKARDANERNKIKANKEYKKVAERFNVGLWVVDGDENTDVRQSDGHIKRLSRMEYLYTYLKDKQMAIAARYFIHWNISYLEKEKIKKSYPSRERVLKSAVWWVNQLMLKRFGLRMPDADKDFDFKPSTIIFSTMPSSGKSFLCNTTNEMFSILGRLINRRGGVLRVSNQEENILRQSTQTMNLIKNRLIFEIYPELSQYIYAGGKFDPFEKASEGEWGLKGCEYIPNTSIFKTRDSAINSIRCELGFFDDPSRGLQESNNIQIHEKITTLYNGDFLDRFESQEDIAVLLTGTMFNPFDIFATEIERALKDGAIKDNRFLNTYISKDKSTVVIVNDCEDEYGNSAFPEFISTQALHKKRDSLPAYDYACIWRQRPIPADGLIFARELLKFYDKLPDDLTPYSFAAIDPTRRKAKDYFSMPIFRRRESTGEFYLVDILYKRKGSMDLMPEIINKIQSNNIVKIFYEENINDTLGVKINEELKKKNLGFCNLIPEYASMNKEQRIADMEATIKANIVFPSNTYVAPKSQMAQAIHHLTQYSDKSEHDDFPDSLALFSARQLVYQRKPNRIKTNNKLPI